LVENISGKIEYDFYDFGSRNYNFGITPVSVSSNLHTLTVGINYKFNWSGGPSHSPPISLARPNQFCGNSALPAGKS
jgi:hypothetical protein